MLHEVLDYVELAFVGRVADELDAETGRNHRQAAQAPRLPVGCVFVRFLKGTETVSYTHLRAHETGRNLVCRLLLEKKKKNTQN